MIGFHDVGKAAHLLSCNSVIKFTHELLQRSEHQRHGVILQAAASFLQQVNYARGVFDVFMLAMIRPFQLSESQGKDTLDDYGEQLYYDIWRRVLRRRVSLLSRRRLDDEC